MGTILKYLFYIALIIIIYLVGKGIFEGNITETTTVGQVVQDVKSGAADMAGEAADKTREMIDESNKGAASNTVSRKVQNAGDTIAEKSGEAWDATKEGAQKAGNAIKSSVD